MRLFPAVLLIGSSLALTMPVAASEIELSDVQLDNVTAGFRPGVQERVDDRQESRGVTGQGETQPPANGNNGDTDPPNVLRSEDGPNVASTVLRNGDSGLAILTRAERLSGFGFASVDIRVISDRVGRLSIGTTEIVATVSD